MTTETAKYLTEEKAREEIKDKAVPLTDVPEHLRALVESGSIKATFDVVSVEVKGQKDRAARIYLRLEGVAIDGMVALCGGRMTKVAEGENKGNGVLDYANYGYDLAIRSTERNALLSTLEGPDAAIRRAAKGLVAAGIPEAAALKVAVDALKAEGKLPADFALPTDFSVSK